MPIVYYIKLSAQMARLPRRFDVTKFITSLVFVKLRWTEPNPTFFASNEFRKYQQTKI